MVCGVSRAQESVNSLLASGEVPGLYTHEELEPLLAPLKEIMGESGFNYRTPYELFVARVVANLHVVVSMDPTHPMFGVRCESNPALYNKCTVSGLVASSERVFSVVLLVRGGGYSCRPLTQRTITTTATTTTTTPHATP